MQSTEVSRIMKVANGEREKGVQNLSVCILKWER